MAVTAGPVTVQDQFGTTPGVQLSKPNRLCAPTNKRNEDPTAPTDPDHLKSWQDKHSAPKFVNQTVVNQFGTSSSTSAGRAPARAGIEEPARQSATAGGTDGRPLPVLQVKRSRGTPKFVKISGVTGADQFGSYAVDSSNPDTSAHRPTRTGEDPTAPSHPEHLLCYKTRNAGVKFTPRNAFATDQFGSQQMQLLRRIELCVPSLKNPGATTTSTTAAPGDDDHLVHCRPATTTTSSTGPITTTTQAATTSTVATTSSTTSTTLYGSPSRAFMDPVRSLLE
jgi:hypothetical protein